MTKYRVAVTDYGFPDLHQEEEVLLPMGFEFVTGQCKTPDEVMQLTRYADAILIERAPISKEVIDHMKRCKIIVRYGVGVDSVDIQAAKQKNIPVVNVPDYGTGEVADHAMALLLSSIRKIPQIVSRVRQGVWQTTPCRPIMGLQGKTLGIAGFGNIGKDVARRAQSFGINTLAYDPYVPENVCIEWKTQKVDWHSLLERSDMISVHLPLTPETRHLFNDEAFERMKSTAYLVNTSRGGVIRTESLMDALKNKKIAGAALDVLEEQPIPKSSPLLQFENCFITSHCAWYSESSLNRLQRHAALEIKRLFSGERPRHIVNGVEV